MFDASSHLPILSLRNIRILRGNIIEYEGKLQSLRSFKDLVERVDVGSECGISFEDYQGMEPDDRVEAYAARDAVGDDDCARHVHNAV